MNFDYQLTSQDLSQYQFAVRNRLARGVRKLGVLSHLGWALALTIPVMAAVVLAAWALPRFSRHHFAFEELAIGFFTGVTFVFAATWLNYFRQRRLLVKPSGPTLSLHHLSLEEAGLRIATDKIETSSRWSLFDEITAYKNIFVLWIEPGQGIVVPKSAFADEAGVSAFLSAVSVYITNAKVV